MKFSTTDLHCHSLASDGSLSPAELVERASLNGVRCLALTDHDTIAGQAEAHRVAKKFGVEMISGIELSCTWRSFNIHILGYHFDLESDVIKDAERSQAKSRLDRAEAIAERLAKKGFADLLEPAQTLALNGIAGRPHFAQAMVEKEYVSSISEAFKKYLGAGKVGDVKSFWPELSCVVDWIVRSGGTAVIAHPRKYNMTLSKLRELIADFKAAGGAGIELITSGQKQGETGMLADLCQRLDLCASLGSDFHSPEYRWAELGRIPPLPDSVTPVWECW